MAGSAGGRVARRRGTAYAARVPLLGRPSSDYEVEAQVRRSGGDYAVAWRTFALNSGAAWTSP